MKEFLLLFRTDYENIRQRNPEQAEVMMKKWMDWIGGIAAQNKLTTKGNRLQSSGRVVKSNKGHITSLSYDYKRFHRQSVR